MSKKSQKQSDSTLPFEYQMKRGSIAMDDIEDADVRAALKKVKKLAAAKKFKEAVAALPKMNFEFAPGNLDSSPGKFLRDKSTVSFGLDHKNPQHKIKVGIEDGNLAITVTVVFMLPVNPGVRPSELDEWLSENGGWAACNAEGGWSYTGDDGGYLSCLAK